jgi:two-component sensor histidine kinase/DNA-binding response OmpR family regulator
MPKSDKVNVLLVDDQPAKLLAYEVILGDLGENLIKASSGREALEQLLKQDIAIALIDVCMPNLDGFELAGMIREHPRFERTAIIFVSSIHLSEVDRLHGYEMGAADYVPVPVVPEVLRAKVRVLAELHRKTRQLERLNVELERRVNERTADLASINERLLRSERRRSVALVAGQMGSWDFDVPKSDWQWDEGQFKIFGVDPTTFSVTLERVRALIDPRDWARLMRIVRKASNSENSVRAEFRLRRPDGQTRWCAGTAVVAFDEKDRIIRIGGVTIDITERKRAEERQALLAREVDHRARNALAIIQAILRLSRADSIQEYRETVEGRIMALARAHTLLSNSRWSGADFHTLVADELAPYRTGHSGTITTSGPPISLQPITAQTLALVLHELATNAAKYGALSSGRGALTLAWEVRSARLILRWSEEGSIVETPAGRDGFGMKLIVASIEQQLAGSVAFDWSGKGLRCNIIIPLSEAAEAPDPASPVNHDADDVSNARFLGLRVLLIEDETLVAMMMKEVLANLGCTVAGPYATVASALEAAKDESFDFALLDVNLGNELVYPVANVLAARGAPFVFLTGYDSDHVDSRFKDTMTLQKPLQQETLRRLLVSKSGVLCGATVPNDGAEDRSSQPTQDSYHGFEDSHIR